jgi:hypothetical protein
MIYRPITTPEGFKRFENIPSDYYACGWIIGETVAKSATSENEPLSPPTYPAGPAILDGVATLVSDGWQNFLDTVEAEGITIPVELLEDE